MYNVKDLPRLEAKINEAFAHANDDQEAAAHFDAVLQQITGPATGLSWDDVTHKLNIVSSWAPDTDGNILNILENTGPATGKVLKDGVITPL